MGRQPSVLALTFTQPMNPVLSTDSRSYTLLAAGRDRILGTADDVRVPIARIAYDAMTQTVSLRTRQKLGLLQPYLLIASGSPLFPITAANGQSLDGNADGVAGGDYVKVVDRASFSPFATSPAPGTAARLGMNRPFRAFQARGIGRARG
jgi:hypothetical protein